MKIQQSTVSSTSQHIAVKEETRTESLKVWTGSQRPDFEHAAGRPALPAVDRVDLSEDARSAVHDTGKNRHVRARGKENSSDTDVISKFISMLTELLTGKKVKITSVQPASEGVDPEKAAELTQAANAAQNLSQPQTQPTAPAGFGLEYDSQSTYLEAEYMNFSAQGMIKTADGQQIEFNLQLTMERAFMSEENVSIRLGDAVKQQDPLVINFDGTAAQLTNTKFSFDINSDGNAEQISFVGPNSGFIALDKNHDGQITNGNELFGTQSGDGFRDLAAYDQDKNGWIDESDQVFNQLQVWSKDEQGNDQLTGLKAKGVGALYLGAISSPFELKNSSNDSLGTVRTSSVYLNEKGTPGTLQQIDLTL